MNKTHGSIFTGIGGFDLGFQKAGWITKWQIEINELQRIILASRFKEAKQFSDIKKIDPNDLEKVDCITAGFPCQDISQCGARSERKGLQGERSGVFWEALRIIKEIQPTWVVLENVTGLLFVNDGKDFATIIKSLAGSGYMGFWRVLNAQYFGVPQKRRRLFLVAGLGRYPSFDFLSDASPVEALPSSFGKSEKSCSENSYPGYCLTAKNISGRINLGHEVLIAEENGWNQMVERERMSQVHGIPCGLDDIDLFMHYSAGNAIIPEIASWIAEKLY